MKKGVILYITEGKECVEDWPQLEEIKRAMAVHDVSIATSEDDVVYRWWHMLCRGVEHICCSTAVFDPGRRMFQPTGSPLRLCG
jgi:hypothetical protein